MGKGLEIEIDPQASFFLVVLLVAALPCVVLQSSLASSLCRLIKSIFILIHAVILIIIADRWLAVVCVYGTYGISAPVYVLTLGAL